MSSSSQVPSQEQPLLLVASVHDVRYFTSLLRSLSFSNRALVRVTAGGLTICVEESHTLLANVYIHADIFDDYTYDPSVLSPSQQLDELPEEEGETTEFEIPLNILIDCLNIFGTAGPMNSSSALRQKRWKRADDGSSHSGDENRDKGQLDQFFGRTGSKGTGMRMTYPGQGYPLTLLIAEDASGPTTTCEITTFEAELSLDLPFDDSQTVLKIILKSSWLREALQELDPSYDKLTFIGNPSPTVQGAGKSKRDRALQPHLRIHATGIYGSTEIDYPDEREVLETFICEEPVRFSYRMSLASRTLRALQSSTKTSLRIDADGLLSLQFLMPTNKPRVGGTSNGYVEFRFLPLDDDVS